MRKWGRLNPILSSSPGSPVSCQSLVPLLPTGTLLCLPRRAREWNEPPLQSFAADREIIWLPCQADEGTRKKRGKITQWKSWRRVADCCGRQTKIPSFYNEEIFPVLIEHGENVKCKFTLNSKLTKWNWHCRVSKYWKKYRGTRKDSEIKGVEGTWFHREKGPIEEIKRELDERGSDEEMRQN